MIVIAASISGLIVVVVSFLYTGSAVATTAIGTLIPVLKDEGEIRTRFGTYLLGAGAVGEFGPILLVTLILSTSHPLHEGDPCRVHRPRDSHGPFRRALVLGRLAGPRAHDRNLEPAAVRLAVVRSRPSTQS